MDIRKLFAIAVIGTSFAASAQAEVVSQAYELTMEQFTAPTTANASISFRECDDCEILRMRVSDATSYTVNSKQVRLEEFRLAVAQLRGSERASVTVLHHLESNTVQSISVSD
ncbi:MAG: hypothetical protein OEW64_08930 [Gammaproteobacteria bacterium]|nr:hypothetical protein [Gammaproteobacteria bacterium]MDH5304208.1 hypothetical protein [Gammaproteobacteria bacterium]MDH5322902.1 hypothetical protein [Gammaproteobacteria bacterium]